MLAGWIAAVPTPGELAPCEHQLAREFDYRGTYGKHRLALFYGAEPEALSAVNLTTVLPLEPLNAVRIDENLRPWALVAHNLGAAEEAAVRARLAQRPHITLRDVTLALLSVDDIAIDWPRGVEDIPLPRRAIRPTPTFEENPAYPYVHARKKNDLIVAAVDTVSKDELYATVEYISSEEIWSRQSASDGLVAAGEHLQQILRGYGTRNVRVENAVNDGADG